MKLKQLQYVDSIESPIKPGQVALDWIRPAELLKGSDSADPRSGNLNQNSVRIQKNVQIIDENVEKLNKELDTTTIKLQKVIDDLEASENESLIQKVNDHSIKIDKNTLDIETNKNQIQTEKARTDNIKTDLGIAPVQTVNRSVHDDLYWIKQRLGSKVGEDINGTPVASDVGIGLIGQTEKISETVTKNTQSIEDTKVDLNLTKQSIASEVQRAVSVETGLQTQINTIGQTGGRGYKTYALMDADKANIPRNTVSKVTNDPDDTKNGDWQWDGTSFSKSPYDALALTKAWANDNAMFKPKTYAVAQDFNNLVAYGAHTFLNSAVWNSSTNRPDITNQWGHVIVIPTTANIITQIAIMGTTGKTFAMRLRTDQLTWQSWQYFYSFDELTTKLKADFNAGYLKPTKTSSSVNLLDPSQVIPAYEVRPDGAILPSTNGTISGLIYCLNREYLFVSGLQTNPAPRYYRFLNQNGIFIKGGYLGNGITESVIPVPVGSYSFQISLKQGNTDPLDISITQIQVGTSKTSYVPFTPGAITHIDKVGLVGTQLNFNSVSSSRNMLDYTTVLSGFEVYNDGRILPQPQSMISPVFEVSGMPSITISGLIENPEIVRYGVFNGLRTDVVQIPKTATTATFSVPNGATTFQFSIRQRSVSIPDVKVIQVEAGPLVTPYTPFVRGISVINGLKIVAGGSSSSVPNVMVSRAFNSFGIWLGDSRVQTSNVDAGDVKGTGFSPNYPKLVKDTLKLSDFSNYAKSGASFAHTTTAQLTWQKLTHQVQTLIDNKEKPTFIVVDAGTNDMNWARSNENLKVNPWDSMGTYDAAMNKDFDLLDMKITMEAMRWCLFKIREAFPDVVCFYATQTQRADTEPTYQDRSNNEMVKMAKRYGFTVIDGLYGFDIVKDFEIWEKMGRYLRDGLHMNPEGMQIMANYYTSQIIQRLMY